MTLGCAVSAASAQTVSSQAGPAENGAALSARVAERWAEVEARVGGEPAPPPPAQLATALELGQLLARNRLHFATCESARSAAEARLASPEGLAEAERAGERTLAAYAIGERKILVSESFAAAATRLLHYFADSSRPSDPSVAADPSAAADPRRAADSSGSAGPDSETSRLPAEALLDVVLWHELAHAIQDRDHDLAALGRAARGFEARAALSAVIEGHAQQCAAALSIQSFSHRRAFDVLSRSHEEAPNGCAARSTRAVAACEAGFAYRAGLRFFRELDALAHPEALVSRAFLDPPKTLWHVEHPAAWVAGETDPGQTLEAPLRAFAGAAFARAVWASSLENATRESLRRAFGALEPERAAALVTGIGGSRVLHVRGRELDERLIFAVLDLGTPARAEAFVAAEEEISRRFDEHGAEIGSRALQAQYRRNEDGALWIEKTCATDAESIERSGLLLTRSDSLVIELNVCGATSEARARELVAMLVRALR